MSTDEFVSLREVARVLGVGRRRAAHFVKSGCVRTRTLPGVRDPQFHRGDVARVAKEAETPARPVAD